MKKLFLSLLAVLALLLAGCKEDVDTSSRYVFKDWTVTDYLQQHERYSEYYKLLGDVPVSVVSKTTVLQLLAARGHYTVFAPTNEAIGQYLNALVKEGIIPEPSWDAFPSQRKLDSIKQVIVFNSIIDSGDMMDYFVTMGFPVQNSTSPEVEFDVPNMNDRKLIVTYTKKPDSLLISGCVMDEIQRDILCINGVIHSMHDVVSPSDESMGHVLKTRIEEGTGGFVLAAKLADACGLLDTLSVMRDERYESLFKSRQIPDRGPNVEFYTPEHRKYGFTYFAETDAFWSKTLGKDVKDISVEDIFNYLDGLDIYPEATRGNDYKSPDNLLNQFVTYHLLPERLSSKNLVYHYNELGYVSSTVGPTVAVQEFYTTMGKRRLLKIFESRESEGVYLNRFPHLDNGRHGTYHELYCDLENAGIRIGDPNCEGKVMTDNGIVYPIEQLLYYSDNTRNGLQRQRIRWTVPSMWPEFMNNDIRCSSRSDNQHKNVYIPYDQIYKYLDDVEMTKETEFYYWTGRGNNWQNMQGDEMTIRGLTDCTMRLPPVPRQGVYELRFAIQSGGDMRGMVQFYWGSNPERLAAMGIPIDLRQGADNKIHTATGNRDSDIGYEKDTGDDDYDAEVDRRLRNNGFMKGCQQYCAGGPGTVESMRQSDICIRRIIVRQPMDPDKTYYVRFKTVMDDPTRYFYMDYLEYCAKDVYDNPETPEDVW